ncbi:MAG: queuosine precursor transporter [Myxococcota bacterium]|nr:queuosine precursor transporter [Myxococcota bacterium]
MQRIVTLDYVTVEDGRGVPVEDPATGAGLVRPAVPELGSDGQPVTDEEGNPRLRPVERFALEPVPGGPPDALRLTDADTGQPILRDDSLFSRIAVSARQAVLASMVAYLFAQFVDVWLFHFWKRVTRGRHLWLRNNGSTMLSQLVDTVCVVLITFWAAIAAGEVPASQVVAWIGGGYSFKLIVALLDTIPFYLCVGWLSRWLAIDPTREHDADDEGIALDEPRASSPR